MSAALLLNPLLGAAPVDPARASSSDDAGFAGVLASATAAGTGIEAANAPAAPVGPATAPAMTGAAAVTNLLVAATGKGLAQPAGPDAAGALAVPEAGVTPGAAAHPQVAAMTSSDVLSGAVLPVTSPGEEAGQLLDGPGAPDLAVPPSPALPPQTPASGIRVEASAPGQTGASASQIANAAASPIPPAAGPDAAASVAQAKGSVPPGPTLAAAAASASEEPTGKPASAPASTQTPVDGEVVKGQAVAPANPASAPHPLGLTPSAPGAAAVVARPDGSPVAAAIAASGNPASADVEVATPAPPTLAAAGPAAPATVDASSAVVTPAVAAGSPPAANGAVQAQLAAAGAALVQKPAARRADAPAAAEVAQPATATVASDATASLELPPETDAGLLPTAVNGSLALNGRTGAANAPSQGAAAATTAPATGLPGGVASATAEATPAALTADLEADLAALDAPMDLPTGEAARLPETPLPGASSIVLQPMANDGRFNAVAQISAQILRRLEGQTTRFELALTPEDLGRVDVMLEIDGDGSVTARLAFDNPAAAAELRAQADQLRRELEAAGLNVSRDGLQFAERDARRDDGGNDRRGAKAFAGAARLEADADVGLAAYRMTTADGRLDVRI
ncbi:MAG TPA: flagellar hook-length control protein FliK [Brevundimonas sp.]|jgi:flagellar hook-length control protein FliK|uniref:flagellar hook-length control protein FliK n=1 Tax=Brevundimonas sp. TaxID=1871086 RepID=UPI002E131834|nr:flagellar hook-length control protein FliK [Brevundimonas sp.]